MQALSSVRFKNVALHGTGSIAVVLDKEAEVLAVDDDREVILYKSKRAAKDDEPFEIPIQGNVEWFRRKKPAEPKPTTPPKK